MKGEEKLGEAEISLIYVLQCCLQIRMGSFNMSAALFPHNFKGGVERAGTGRGTHLGRRFGFGFLLGFSFSFLQSTFTLSRSFPPKPYTVK